MAQAEFVEVFGLERRNGRAEVDGAGLDLGDAAAGADGLVVDLHLGGFAVVGGPLDITGYTKEAPAPVTFCAWTLKAIAAARPSRAIRDLIELSTLKLLGGVQGGTEPRPGYD